MFTRHMFRGSAGSPVCRTSAPLGSEPGKFGDTSRLTAAPPRHRKEHLQDLLAARNRVLRMRQKVLPMIGLLALMQAAATAAADDGVHGPVTDLPLPRFVSIRTEPVNVRRGPSVQYRIDWTFNRRGWPVEVKAEYGAWRKIKDVDGAEGWVHQSLLSGTRTVVVLGSELAPSGPARARAQPFVPMWSRGWWQSSTGARQGTAG
jgi:hypothetical protein